MFDWEDISYADRTLISIYKDSTGVGSWMIAKEDEDIVKPALIKFIEELNKLVADSKRQTRPTF